METLTAPAGLAEGAEIASKYRLGKRLTAVGRQAEYETNYRGADAILRAFRCQAAGEATVLTGGFATALQLPHPHLLAIYDYGEEDCGGEHIAWIVMERGDECLGDILRQRTLEEQELRYLLDSILPTLEFLNDHKVGHSDIRASNVYACGDSIKLTPDRIGEGALGTESLQVGRLILEALTGSREPSGAEQLHSPFREIANAGGRWHLGRIRAALVGDAVPVEVAVAAAPSEPAVVESGDFSQTQPKYRKFAGLAVGGALAALALCALLIRGAHQAPEAGIQTAVGAVHATQAPAGLTITPASTPSRETAAVDYAPAPRGWGITAGAYDNAADAEKRLAELVGKTDALDSRVYSTGSAGRPRYSVLLAAGMTESQAKKQLARLRRSGVARSTHIARFE
jgi:hypothetical protein